MWLEATTLDNTVLRGSNLHLCPAFYQKHRARQAVLFCFLILVNLIYTSAKNVIMNVSRSVQLLGDL